MKMVAPLLAVILNVVEPVQAQAPPTPQNLKTLHPVAQPLDPGPLTSPAPDQSQWIVTSSTVPGFPPPPDATGQPNLAPTTTTVNKSNKIYQVITVSPDGQKLVRWSDRQFQASYPPGATSPNVEGGNSFPDFIDFSKSDYPDFSWISARNYAGVAQLGAVKVLLFKAKVSAASLRFLSQYHNTRGPLETIALVDFQTRRPLMLQIEGELLTYQFTNLVPNLSLPLDAKSQFDQARKIQKQFSILPSG